MVSRGRCAQTPGSGIRSLAVVSRGLGRPKCTVFLQAAEGLLSPSVRSASIVLGRGLKKLRVLAKFEGAYRTIDLRTSKR